MINRWRERIGRWLLRADRVWLAYHVLPREAVLLPEDWADWDRG